MLRQLLFFVLISNVCSSYDDFFTATSRLEQLLDTLKQVVDDLNDFVQREEERLYILKWHLVHYIHQQEKAAKNISRYIENPINAFTLIKKLTTGLDLIEDSIKRGIQYANSITLRHKHLEYPCLDDLKGTTLGLKRLQETYNLKIPELSQGILNGVNCSSAFSSDDCYEIGQVLYYGGDLELAFAWMLEAYKKYEAMDKILQKSLAFTKADILEHIESLKEKTNQEKHFSHGLQNKSEENFNKVIEHQLRKNKNSKAKSNKDKINYETLCRGEMTMSSNTSNRLKCWLSSIKYHPFLKIAPIKVEQVFFKPDIFNFHDFLSDFETEHIISKAKPKLLRSYVDQPNGDGQLRPSDLRISKSAALLDEEPILATISQRIHDITGLDMQLAETFQVANYGIGGFYAPHYDFARPGSLADVAQGGATIFTKLGLSILPKKRMAVYWLNLHPSGECDWSTIHAACPVLRGSKWGKMSNFFTGLLKDKQLHFIVGTMWIHEGGQELSRPCPMEQRPIQYKSLSHELRP